MNIKQVDAVPSKGPEQEGLMENISDWLNIRLLWWVKLERNDKASQA